MVLEVIIDQSVRKLLPAVKSEKIRPRLVDDAPGAVQDALEPAAGGGKGLIVFLSLANLLKLQKTVGARKMAAACVTFIVFTGANRAVAGLKPALYDRIDIRTRALTAPEYRFILSKQESCFRENRRRKKREEDNLRALMDTYRDQEDLVAIGRALSSEKNIDRLFRKILALAQKITGADAGTIYIIEENARGEKQIRVKYSETISKKISFEESVLPFNTGSIAGFVAITGQVLNIPDVYKLTPKDPVSFNPAFDYAHYYRTKSMLVVPMRNHFDEIIGVIQLINSKEDYRINFPEGQDAHTLVLENASDFERMVVPFNPRYNRLLEAVANQAAIAIENTRMIAQIQHQFEEFVRASVLAIESRDEATSGHSFRVAGMCLRLAEAVDRRREGPFKNIGFTEVQKKEIEYAALLHDFGKIYLDTRIFLKAKKLYPEDLALLMQKLEIACRQAELGSLAREIELMAAPQKDGATEGSTPAAGEIRAERKNREELRKKILLVREKIRRLNEPSVAAEDPGKVIAEIVAVLKPFQCRDLDGLSIELLTGLERMSLAVPKGSLNSAERKEIERHVEQTYNFVSKIPWPAEFARIPEIARAHHEMLDGSGYPRRIFGRDNIPIEARMMTIADIFDALTAHDRPYKKAVPVEKALEILAEEAKRGRLDPDLLALFCECRAWEEKTDESAVKT